MGAAIGVGDPADLNSYLIIGDGGSNNSFRYWKTEFDLNYAKRIAITWVVSGWGTRVIDLGLAQANWSTTPPSPNTVFSAVNISDVTGIVPGVTQFCLQKQPVYPPYGLNDADFAAWLTNFSKGTPTYTLPVQTKNAAQVL